jgi:hypothetical protein
MNKFDGFKKSNTDETIEALIVDHCERFGLAGIDGVKMFPILARRQWLKRFMAHSELFKLTIDVPGDIAELGVFRGLGLFTWANLLETYCIGDRTKVVFGFDNWRGFTKFEKEDGETVSDANKVIGGFSPETFYDELENAIKIFDSDRFIPQKPRIKLIEGNIEESVPKFVKENPGVRFSLVHFDCDLYKPTKAALEALWPIVSRSGVILFDEYSIHDWPGETQAVDEFIADKKDVQIKKLSWNNTPAGYIIKS